MEKSGVKVFDLLNQLPSELLDTLSEKHKVNYQVKKLSGQLMFKLLLYNIVCTQRGSLNTLMTLFEDVRFRLFAGIDSNFSTKRNSLADRISTLNVGYFESIFNHVRTMCSAHMDNKLFKDFKIQRFDSTLVGLSAKLLSQGMTMGRKKKDQAEGFKFIKFTIGFSGLGVDQIQFNTDQITASEDIALAAAIKKTCVDNTCIVVFDKGLKKRKAFAAFNLEGRSFVTRINETHAYKVVESRTENIGQKSKTLEIVAERYIRFSNGGVSTKKDAPFWRLIIAKSLKTGELLYFLTNLLDLTAIEITEIYRLRWDIEVFFRFLKQELNFSHLISRSVNGIKVMTYMTLIAAMLILLFRHQNQLKGFKIVKMKFANELQTELIKELIIFCGGKPEILDMIMRT